MSVRTFRMFMPLILLVMASEIYVLATNPLVRMDVAKISAQHVVVSKHAEYKHVEASSIKQCLNDAGPATVYRDRWDKSKYYLTCKTAFGWGLAVFVETAAGLINKTAFSPGDGSLNDLLNYLALSGATRYNGVLPQFAPAP